MSLQLPMAPAAAGFAFTAVPVPGASGTVERADQWSADVRPRRTAPVALHSRRTAPAAGEAVLVTALEAERRRIALDLHDGVGQSLTLIKLNAQSSAELLASGAGGQAQEVLQQLLQRVNEALREVRRACSDLWPPMLEDLGLLPTLSWALREFASSCPGVQLDSRIEVGETDVPKRLHAPIYRILQEAMHNVVKHAAATRLTVQLRRGEDAITLVIRDNGRGFDAGGRCAGGLGLAGMKQRACMSGGDYALRSRPGRGTRVAVTWPLTASRRAS